MRELAENGKPDVTVVMCGWARAVDKFGNAENQKEFERRIFSVPRFKQIIPTNIFFELSVAKLDSSLYHHLVVALALSALRRAKSTGKTKALNIYI